ncbi:thiamine pyrophosphate-dependent dehydrogenase E1 component subunit alpha [Petrachloros mirabilis]
MAFRERLTSQDLIQMYRWMVLTRAFEDRICEGWGKSGIVELPHGSQGQEAIAVGTCYGLRKEDQVLPSLRTRGAFLVKGVSTRTQMAGVYAKANGPARAKATAHHMGDPALGVLVGSGLVGASITVATGAALGFKLQKKDNVVINYFGDGAAERGDFHEALNFAAVFRLPIVFVLENNGYAEYTPLAKHYVGEDFAIRARGYGFPGVCVDGQDVLAVYEAAQEAITRARATEGPTLLECVTYRFRNHCEIEPPHAYRDPAEVERWRARDPITLMQDHLIKAGVLDMQRINSLEEEVKAEIDDAVRFAESSPFPSATELYDNVYAPEDPNLVGGIRA